mgnify:CR=1 FL=1
MTLEQIASHDGHVVNLTLKGEPEAIRATIELMDRDTVRVDAPYHGYRRELLPVTHVLDITP